MRKQSILFPRDSTWPQSDNGLSCPARTGFPALGDGCMYLLRIDWFIVLFASDVIGSSNYLVLVLRHSIQNGSIMCK